MAEPLLAPVGGVPKLVESSQELGEVLAQLKSGSGQTIIDMIIKFELKGISLCY